MANQYRVNKHLTVDIEAKTMKDLFWAIHEYNEIFAPESCGICGCEETQFYVRKVVKEKEEFEYPERKCMDPECGAALSYHLNVKGGGMYPGRKLEDGKWDYKNKGWKKFVSQKKKGDS